MRHRTLIFMAAIAVSTAACSSGGTTGGLDVEQNYTIALNSANEVPAPKTTLATGTADVVVYPERIDWQLAGANINAITMAHIHNGAVGVAVDDPWAVRGGVASIRGGCHRNRSMSSRATIAPLPCRPSGQTH